MTIKMEEQANREFDTCNAMINECNQLRRLEFGSILPDTRFVISEDEYACIMRMKELKDDIERLRNEYHVHCEQAQYCRAQTVAAAEKLLDEFNKWDANTSHE